MDSEKKQSMLVISTEEWHTAMLLLREIHQHLQSVIRSKSVAKPIASPYIPAREFMTAVRIGRSHFDKLVQQGRVTVTRKGRRIYVPVSEIERYFNS